MKYTTKLMMSFLKDLETLDNSCCETEHNAESRLNELRNSFKTSISQQIDKVTFPCGDFGSAVSEIQSIHLKKLNDEISSLNSDSFGSEKFAGLFDSIEGGSAKRRNEIAKIAFSESKKYVADWHEDVDFRSCISKAKSIGGVSKLTEQSGFGENYKTQLERLKKQTAELNALKEDTISKAISAFLKKYDHDEMYKTLLDLCGPQTDYEEFVCETKLRDSVNVGTREYPLNDIVHSKDVRFMLDSRYFFLMKYIKNKNAPYLEPNPFLCFPFCANLDGSFNYAVKYTEKQRDIAVEKMRSIILSLLRQLPPSKINFTMVDPVRNGESFSLFNQFIESDDRTNSVIGESILSKKNEITTMLGDIESYINKIENNYLKGKYSSIQEYNSRAWDNAEPYKVLVIMDFPVKFDREALSSLEGIISTGSKKGVYTLIGLNESKLSSMDGDKTLPLVKRVLSSSKCVFTLKNYSLSCEGVKYKNSELIYNMPRFPKQEVFAVIAEKMKAGISSAGKVVIDIDRLTPYLKKGENEDATKAISIPIGIKGANEVQNFVIGNRRYNHAMIVGAMGTGKTRLLHTIIYGALSKYTPDELQLYLIDSKQGIEFKIYAGYRFPAIKVVSIKTDREYVYRILKTVEEDSIHRAELFQSVHSGSLEKNVTCIEEYNDYVMNNDDPRNREKLPRILIVMDDFQDLFYEKDFLSSECEKIMKNFSEKGRAHGIHMLLSTTSFSSIRNIDQSIFKGMFTRIVFDCSSDDASMMLENGVDEVRELTRRKEAGRAIFNSEKGSGNSSFVFRAAYIDAKKQPGLLKKLEAKCESFTTDTPTCVLLSYAEDNRFCIFNTFYSDPPKAFPEPGRLYLGENLRIFFGLDMKFENAAGSNLIAIGEDRVMARNMFTFSALSLCVNSYILNQSPPQVPFIYILNYSPLEDRFNKDSLKVISDELGSYIVYAEGSDYRKTDEIITRVNDLVTNGVNENCYLLIFGYHNAADLRNSGAGANSGGNILSGLLEGKPQLSLQDKLVNIMSSGPSRGVHTLTWSSSYDALDSNDKNYLFTTNCDLKIAFSMPKEEYESFFGRNDHSELRENDAAFYRRASDNVFFRPYERPSDYWIQDIAKQLNSTKKETDQYGIKTGKIS